VTEDLKPLPWRFPSLPLAAGIAPNVLHGDYPNVGVVLFRVDAIVEAGGFDPHVIYYQDADLMIRIAPHRENLGVNVVGILYRFRAPSKARSDYFWTNRCVVRWRPKHVGVRWTAAVRFQYRMKRMIYNTLCEDAHACISIGHRRDALQCLLRAL